MDGALRSRLFFRRRQETRSQEFFRPEPYRHALVAFGSQIKLSSNLGHPLVVRQMCIQRLIVLFTLNEKQVYIYKCHHAVGLPVKPEVEESCCQSTVREPFHLPNRNLLQA